MRYCYFKILAFGDKVISSRNAKYFRLEIYLGQRLSYSKFICGVIGWGLQVHETAYFKQVQGTKFIKLYVWIYPTFT